MKILLYTDSRGLKLESEDYVHYSERLAERYDVDAFLRPFKKTTTLDFLQFVKEHDISAYDHVILHVGIVEYSPRRQKSCWRMYESKRQIFDEVFGKDNIKAHLSRDFGYTYKDDKIINMYSMDMARRDLLPRLRDVHRLIWVSNTRDVPFWNDPTRQNRRGPLNMHIIHDYAHLFMDTLNESINLMQWDEDGAKEHTIEGIHLNKKGSDFLYNKIVERLES